MKQLTVLDLIIETLAEHEKVLDSKIHKLELQIDRIEEAIK